MTQKALNRVHQASDLPSFILISSTYFDLFLNFYCVGISISRVALTAHLYFYCQVLLQRNFLNVLTGERIA